MGSVMTGLKRQLARFTPKQLVAAGVLIALVLGGSLGLYRWMTAPTYDVLFAGLSETDAAAVVSAVQATGTPYKLVQAGSDTTILVPVSDAPQLRLSLAAQNLPGHSIVGYELLDNQGVTTSTFTQQVDYQRALEGELERTLMSINGVSAASVHIVLPQDQLYTTQQTPATASVTLTTSLSLPPSEVAAVTHLVASSVPGLSPQKVTVTDANGQLLSQSGKPGMGGSDANIESQYANRLENRAESMLTSLTGPGRSVVRVQATLDFTKRTKQSELFDPTRVATNSAQSNKETYSATGTNPTGPLTSNPQLLNQQNTSSTYNHQTAARKYSVSRQVTSEVDAPGSVKRLTVSVLLDPKYAGKANVAQVKRLVENSIGFDANRGDQIDVEFLPFNKTTTKPYKDPMVAVAAAAQRTKMIVGLGVAGALLLAVLALAFALLRGRKKNAADQSPTDTTAAAAGPLPGGPDPAGQLSAPSRAGGEADRLLERVAERPEDAAKVLRGLLASDQVGGDR